jgi:hypothetical protein
MGWKTKEVNPMEFRKEGHLFLKKDKVQIHLQIKEKTCIIK